MFILCNDKSRATEFFNNTKLYISKLTLNSLDPDEIYEKKKRYILQRIKADLNEHLDIAISLSIALNYDVGIIKKHKDYAKHFRHANIFNHSLVSFPLLNYSESDYIESISLIDCDINKILTNCEQKRRNKFFKLDENKLKWSPRFIHLDEFYFCNFFYFFGNNNPLYKNNSMEIFNRYIKVNNLPSYCKNPVSKDEIIYFNEKMVNQRKLIIEDTKKKKIKIGLVNTLISEDIPVVCLSNPKKLLNIDSKQKLFKILNIAKEEKIDYLVFPEFYLPVVWLYEFSNFAKSNGITIITGLHYLTCNERAYNMVCTLQTSKSKRGYKNCFPLFREKNYYAPDEKILISKMGFRCKDNYQPFYYIISNPNIEFSTILCFEFTDIISRASMKNMIDILFVPQFNKDTNYFSSIVESTARDLHCFIIQANTSIYGDSRVTAPFKTDYKNILQIKGGINDVVVVEELDIFKFHSYQKTYTKRLEKAINLCYSFKRLKIKILVR